MKNCFGSPKGSVLAIPPLTRGDWEVAIHPFLTGVPTVGESQHVDLLTKDHAVR